MSNTQAAQVAAHSVPNSNGAQPQYIQPLPDHAQHIPGSVYSHPHDYQTNQAVRSGYTMSLPHGTQVIQNPIQTNSGNHNVITVIPNQPLPQAAMSQQPFQRPPGQRMQFAPHGQPPHQVPFSGHQVYYPPNIPYPPPQFMPQFQVGQMPNTEMPPMSQYMVPMMHQQVSYPQQQHQQIPPTSQSTVQKREKKILNIIDPTSNKSVIEGQTPKAAPETTETKPPIQPNVPSTSTPAIGHNFQKAVASRLNDKESNSESSTTEKSVSLSVDLNDNSIGSDHMNGQDEKHRIAEESSVIEKADESTLASEVDSSRSVKDGEHENERQLDSESKETDLSVIEELDVKLQQIYEKQKEDIDNMVYDRSFLTLIREVKLNKNGELVKPLKTEEQLKEMGIDQASMPVQSQTLGRDRQRKEFGARQDAFMPGFVEKRGEAQQANRLRPHNYSGRPSGNRRDQQKKPQVIARPSITRQSVAETLRKAENAWKPSLGKSDPYEKKRKEIRGILNKITPTTFNDLSNEFMDHKVYENEDTLPMIVDLIFDKAVEEPKFCQLYSTLCKNQTDVETNDEKGRTRPFRQAIIKKCQTTFERSTKNATEEAIETTKKEIDDENQKPEKDEKKLKELVEKLEELQGKEKRRMLGTIKFIGELYRHMLITDNIIQWCSVHLIKQNQNSGDDVYIEYCVQLIETVGPISESRKKEKQPPSQDFLNQILAHLNALMGQVSSRVRFMIMNLEDMRKNNWTPIHGNTGPKKIEEVRNEIAQEELMAQREREEFEKRQQQQQYRDHDRRQDRRPPNYGGRGSLDSGKFVGDRRAQAAAAASTQGSSMGLRKDASLKSALQDAPTFGRKSWTTGAGGGGSSGGIKASGNPPAQGQKIIPRYPGRGSEQLPSRPTDFSHQSTSREQSSRSSTPKPDDRKGGPIISKSSSEDRVILEERPTSADQEPTVNEENMEKPDVTKIKNSVKASLDEHMDNLSTAREAADNLARDCKNSEHAKLVFFNVFDHAVAKFKIGSEEDEKRCKAGEVLRRSFGCSETEKYRKSDVIEGVANYVKWAIEVEHVFDVPQVWEYVACIISSAIVTSGTNKDQEEEEDVIGPNLADFTPVFKLFSESDLSDRYELLIRVLKGMIANFKKLHGEADVTSFISLTFEEAAKQADFYRSNELQEALRKEISEIEV